MKLANDYEDYAAIMNYAYRFSSNRDNSVSLAAHHFPDADPIIFVHMWEAIDAYVDDDTKKYPRVIK